MFILIATFLVFVCSSSTEEVCLPQFMRFGSPAGNRRTRTAIQGIVRNSPLSDIEEEVSMSENNTSRNSITLTKPSDDLKDVDVCEWLEQINLLDDALARKAYSNFRWKFFEHLSVTGLNDRGLELSNDDSIEDRYRIGNLTIDKGRGGKTNTSLDALASALTAEDVFF